MSSLINKIAVPFWVALRFNEIVHFPFLLQCLVCLAMAMKTILILIQRRQMREGVIQRGRILMAKAKS